MKNPLQNLMFNLRVFLQGRYGNDQLNRLLYWVGLALLFVSLFGRFWMPLQFASLIGLGVMCYVLFRTLSRNIAARQKENMRYLKLTSGIRRKLNLCKERFVQRKTHKYYRCPNCKSYVRIRKPPKGKSIAIRCTKCSNEFIKRT